MASLNQCNFIGRAAREPETRFTGNGQAVTNLTIACGEKFKNKNGEYEERTEWVPLVFWGKLAEIVAEYVTKGKEIYVSGRMQTRKWQDKDGNDKYTTEIVGEKMIMLGGKGERQQNTHQNQDRANGVDAPPFEDVNIPF